MTVVSELQYFAPVTFFKKLIKYSNVKFDVYEEYRKMSFRARCMVVGANGVISLSVPLREGREQQKPFKEVKIDNRQKWQVQHWRTITACYNRSPWFEYYRDGLAALYATPVDLLVDWDLLCWNWVTGQLGLSVVTTQTTGYQATYEEGIFEDWRNHLVPRSIHTRFPEPVRYRQVFEERTGFIPHLSILDLLFCEGRNTMEILRRNR